MFGAGRTERCGPLWMDEVRCWCVMILTTVSNAFWLC